MDTLSQIRTSDDEHIDVIIDEKIAYQNRPFFGLTKIRRSANAAIQKASIGDRVAVIILHVNRGVRGTFGSKKILHLNSFLTRGELQDQSEVRERKEKIVSSKAPARAVSYDASNLPPLSQEARALLDRIDRQAKERLELSSAQQRSGRIVAKRRAPIGITSKRQKSVVSK